MSGNASIAPYTAIRRVRRTWAAVVRWFRWQTRSPKDDMPPHCHRCDSCGEDGCCPAERCDNGPLCAGYYGNRDQRHEAEAYRWAIRHRRIR